LPQTAALGSYAYPWSGSSRFQDRVSGDNQGGHLSGLAAAVLASVLFNVGLVLQALDARAAPSSLGLRVALLGRLLRRPLWVTGLALGLLGTVPQAIAYSRAPFVVVQPVLALGLLLVLLLGALILH